MLLWPSLALQVVTLLLCSEAVMDTRHPSVILQVDLSAARCNCE